MVRGKCLWVGCLDSFWYGVFTYLCIYSYGPWTPKTLRTFFRLTDRVSFASSSMTRGRSDKRQRNLPRDPMFFSVSSGRPGLPRRGGEGVSKTLCFGWAPCVRKNPQHGPEEGVGRYVTKSHGLCLLILSGKCPTRSPCTCEET